MPNREETQRAEQEQARQALLEEATAYEELVRTKGFGYIKAYYLTQVQQLTNELLMQGEKPITDFEAHRRELSGLRGLLGHIQNRLDTLQAVRKEEQDAKSEKKG